MTEVMTVIVQFLASAVFLPLGAWLLLVKLGAGGVMPGVGAPRERVCAWLWSMVVAAAIAYLAPLAVLRDAIQADPRLAVMWLAYAAVWPVMVLGAARYARLMERLKVEVEARAS